MFDINILWYEYVCLQDGGLHVRDIHYGSAIVLVLELLCLQPDCLQGEQAGGGVAGVAQAGVAAGPAVVVPLHQVLAQLHSPTEARVALVAAVTASLPSCRVGLYLHQKGDIGNLGCSDNPTWWFFIVSLERQEYWQPGSGQRSRARS